jgi:hypothetical protein
MSPRLQAQQYSHIEYENLSTFQPKSLFAPQITIYGSQIRKDAQFGVYFFSLLNPNWGQAYGGVLFRPASWITLNAGFGLERDSAPLRLNAGAFMSLGRLTLLQVYEYGGSGFWYNIILNYGVDENLKSGIIFKRFYGLGPNFEFNIHHTPMTITAAPLYDFEFDCVRFMLTFRYGLF